MGLALCQGTWDCGVASQPVYRSSASSGAFDEAGPEAAGCLGRDQAVCLTLSFQAALMISLIWKYYSVPVAVVPRKWITPLDRLVAFPTRVAGKTALSAPRGWKGFCGHVWWRPRGLCPAVL